MDATSQQGPFTNWKSKPKSYAGRWHSQLIGKCLPSHASQHSVNPSINIAFHCPPALLLWKRLTNKLLVQLDKMPIRGRLVTVVYSDAILAFLDNFCHQQCGAHISRMPGTYLNSFVSQAATCLF
jgi:hypothetical protein